MHRGPQQENMTQSGHPMRIDVVLVVHREASMNDNQKPSAELIEHLSRYSCVLFVGDALDGISQSAWLASTLIDACGAHSACPVPACRSGKCIQPHACVVPLPRAAQLYASSTDRQSLVDFVIRHIDNADPPGPVHRALATLPVQVIITTAYDDRLETALREAGRPCLSVVHDTDVPYHDPEHIQVIRLYGTVSQPESLLLTQDDIADLFTHLSPITRIIVQAHLASKTLLFVGCKLDDYFRQLYRQTIVPLDRSQRPAYAVQWPPDEMDAASWRGQIVFHQAEPLSFLEELAQSTRIQLTRPEPTHLPSEPYKFLDYYTREDAAIFFGRDLEADLLLSTVLAHKLTVFYGRSGTGKTSLLLACLIPALERAGYRTAYARMLSEPAAEVKAAVLGLKQVEQLSQLDQGRRLVDVLADAQPPPGRLVVILDQFEEFFIRQGGAVRRAFAHELVNCLVREDLDLRFVLSQRDDYLGALDEIAAVLPGDVFDHRFRLDNLTREKALLAILKPAEAFSLSVEEALREQLIADLEDQGLEPTNLQIVLYRLYRDAVEQGLWHEVDKKGTGLTLARYRVLGGTREILAGYLDEVLGELPEDQQQGARAILKSMVTVQRTKAALSAHEIAHGDLVARVGLDETQLDELLAYLRERRVVRKLGDKDRYELTHEVMVDRVWAWFSTEELQVLDLRDMLRREVKNYQTFGHLIGGDKLALLHAKSEAISEVNADELELLLVSTLMHYLSTDTWLTAVHLLDAQSRPRILRTVATIAENEKYHDEIRAKAIRLMASITEESIPYLVELLFDESLSIRRVAGETLLEYDSEQVGEQLAEKCLDPDPQKRLRTALSLRNLDLPSSTEALGKARVGKTEVQIAWIDRSLAIVTSPKSQVLSQVPALMCLTLTDDSDFASGVIAAFADKGHLIDILGAFGSARSAEKLFTSNSLLDYQIAILFRGDSFTQESALLSGSYLVEFVQAGGTLVATPWLAWESHLHLHPILPVRIKPVPGRANFHEDQVITWRILDPHHSLCQTLPSSFSFRGSYESLLGSEDAEILIVDSQNNPSLATKKTGLGQVIYVNVCGHDCASNPWDESEELRILFTNIFEYFAQRYCDDGNDV